MVKSLLDDTIDYPEAKILDKADKDFEASTYEIPLFDMDVMIALGQPKYSFVEKNIIYYPIYLVKNSLILLKMLFNQNCTLNSVQFCHQNPNCHLIRV